MPTIAFVSTKGGVGKTTSALLLAMGLAERGHAVSMVDSDPNLPLKAWAELPGKPGAIGLYHAPSFQDLPGELRRAKLAAEWVVVDTEGGLTDKASAKLAFKFRSKSEPGPKLLN